MSERSCIFCNGPLGANRAKEHVVPDWLLQHLHIKEDEIFQAVATSSNSEIVEGRTIDMDSLVEGRVCDDCNNGWMSDLENEAKPLLMPLIDGKRTVFNLTDQERLVISRWAAKTSYVLSNANASLLDNSVGPEHLRFMEKNPKTLPSGVGAFAQQVVPTREFAYYQRNRWPEFQVIPREGEPLPGSYKIGCEFRNLLLLVAHWPAPLSRYVLAAGIHLPLWPLCSLYPCYYSRFETPLPYDSKDMLDNFGKSLGVAYELGDVAEANSG